MMGLIIAVQIVLPLALILWFALLPAEGLFGLLVQALGTGAFLFALARVAQWAADLVATVALRGTLAGCCYGICSAQEAVGAIAKGLSQSTNFCLPKAPFCRRMPNLAPQPPAHLCKLLEGIVILDFLCSTDYRDTLAL